MSILSVLTNCCQTALIVNSQTQILVIRIHVIMQLYNNVQKWLVPRIEINEGV